MALGGWSIYLDCSNYKFHLTQYSLVWCIFVEKLSHIFWKLSFPFLWDRFGQWTRVVPLLTRRSIWKAYISDFVGSDEWSRRQDSRNGRRLLYTMTIESIHSNRLVHNLFPEVVRRVSTPRLIRGPMRRRLERLDQSFCSLEWFSGLLHLDLFSN